MLNYFNLLFIELVLFILPFSYSLINPSHYLFVYIIVISDYFFYFIPFSFMLR